MAEEKEGSTPTLDVPSSEEFTRALGQIVWLMTMSKAHANLPIVQLQSKFIAPLMFKQVRVFTKGKQPLAALSWAYASTDLRARLQRGDRNLSLQDWRSGPEIVVVDCVSPFVDGQIFEQQFIDQVNSI